jgi:hypothetical protein
MVRVPRPVCGANPTPLTVTEVPTGPDVGLKVITGTPNVNVTGGAILPGVAVVSEALIAQVAKETAVAGTVNTAVNAPLASGVANTMVLTAVSVNVTVTSPSIPGTQPLPVTVIVLPM